MNKNALIALGVVILAVAAFVAFGNRGNEVTTQDDEITPPTVINPTTPPPAAQNPNPTPTPPSASESAEISMAPSGFSPSNLTIKKGTTVTFVNNDSKPRWPASAPHPTHTDYPGFDPKQAIVPADSWSFTFDKVGTWRFHDHLTPTLFGSITVTE